jgi:hypothetical protein
MRLKGSLPDAFAVAEVPKHEIRSPHDWLFPPGISRRTDSYNPLTGTPDRLTFSLGRVRDKPGFDSRWQLRLPTTNGFNLNSRTI